MVLTGRSCGLGLNVEPASTPCRLRPAQRNARRLDYLNNRYHDPTLARFISVDLLVTITRDAYGYGGNNPIMYSDPSGLRIAPSLPGGPGNPKVKA